MHADAPAENVKAARAAGLTVIAYDVDRRHVRDQLLAAGVQGFISDDPVYLSEQPSPHPADPYTAQTYWHGCLASDAGRRGRFTAPSSWGYEGVETRYFGTLQGWGCPIASERYTISFGVAFDDGDGTGSGWAGLLFGADSDWQWNDDPRGESVLVDGYQALLRVDGSLELHRVEGGQPTPLRVVHTPAVGFDGAARVSVAVTPAEVTVGRADTGDAVTIADEAHRGGYWHLGRRGAAVRFFHVTIT